MEASTKILVVCTHDGILATILRLLTKNTEWNATGTTEVTQALELITSNDYDLLLLGSGLTGEQEQQLAGICADEDKKIRTVHHYGGGSGLLFTEIYQALDSR